MKEHEVVARTIYGEARNQLYGGLVAVFNVIDNRYMARTWYGGTYTEVCKKPWQFSCWNDGDPNKRIIEDAKNTDRKYLECTEITKLGMRGELPDLTFSSLQQPNLVSDM